MFLPLGLEFSEARATFELLVLCSGISATRNSKWNTEPAGKLFLSHPQGLIFYHFHKVRFKHVSITVNKQSASYTYRMCAKKSPSQIPLELAELNSQEGLNELLEKACCADAAGLCRKVKEKSPHR